MELTMKKYIGINIVLFILWIFLSILTIFLIGLAINSGNIKIEIIIYCIFFSIIILLRCYLNLLITKSFISSLTLIIFTIVSILFFYLLGSPTIFSIYLTENFNKKIINILIELVSFFSIINIIFFQSFINLLFIKKNKFKLKSILNFIILNIVFIIVFFFNKEIGDKNSIIEIFNNIFLIIFFICSLIYQKKIERDYVYYLQEKNIKLEKNLNNNEIFIYGTAINLILIIITFTNLYIGATFYKSKIIFILLALLIFIITKFLKFFIINKIFKLNSNYIKIEILIYFIFTFLMLFKNIPYEIKIFTIPLIYIYLDMLVMRRILKNEFFKLKKISLKSIITVIVIITLILFILLKNYTIFLIVGLNYILPILILIEKLIEYNAVKEIEAKNIY